MNLDLRLITFILAGGEGRRLSPLNHSYPKPLMPFGCDRRLIDFALSNCANSGVRQGWLLTQYKSELIHDYVDRAWNQEDDFFMPLPPSPGQRYNGTADAVLKNAGLWAEGRADFVLVLSSDHVYRMDYRSLVEHHMRAGAEVTVATVEMDPGMSQHFGVVESDSQQRIVGFKEKPRAKVHCARPRITVSMGVYLFNAALLTKLAGSVSGLCDFGRDVLPALIGSHRVSEYRFQDTRTREPLYWRDLGTIKTYFDANMDLLAEHPPDGRPEASWRKKAQSIISDSARVAGARIFHSVITPGVVVEPGAKVSHSVLLPGSYIGHGATISDAIVDECASVAADDRIGFKAENDRARFTVDDSGIVVVQRTIPANEHPMWSATANVNRRVRTIVPVKPEGRRKTNTHPALILKFPGGGE